MNHYTDFLAAIVAFILALFATPKSARYLSPNALYSPSPPLNDLSHSLW